MSNVYNESGATLAKIVALNNTYSYLSTNIGNVKFGFTTDLKKWVYSDILGGIYKCLTDASGSSHTPEGRVFVSDSNGSAASYSGLSFSDNVLSVGSSVICSGLTASKLVFTSSNKTLTSTGIGTSSQFLKADGSLDNNTYLTGNQAITLSGVVTGNGTTAITTAIADSALSIAKTNGLQTALDSKIGGSGTQYYVPYFSATRTLVNSPIYTNGTNVAIGTTHLNAALDFGNVVVNKTSGMTGNELSNVIKLYDDGTNFYGFGISNDSLNYSLSAGGAHRFWIAAIEKMNLNNTRLSLTNNLVLGSSVTGATATPAYIDTGLSSSNGTEASKCKLFLYKTATDFYGSGVGSTGDIQYHAKTGATDTVFPSHNFYINDEKVFSVYKDSTNSKNSVRILPGGGDGIDFIGDNGFINRISCQANSSSALVIQSNYENIFLSGRDELNQNNGLSGVIEMSAGIVRILGDLQVDGILNPRGEMWFGRSCYWYHTSLDTTINNVVGNIWTQVPINGSTLESSTTSDPLTGDFSIGTNSLIPRVNGNYEVHLTIGLSPLDFACPIEIAVDDNHSVYRGNVVHNFNSAGSAITNITIITTVYITVASPLKIYIKTYTASTQRVYVDNFHATLRQI